MNKQRSLQMTLIGIAVVLLAARGTVAARISPVAHNNAMQCLTWTPFLSSGTGTDEQRGITALSPTDIWTVGTTSDISRGVNSAQIRHWNGTAWTIVPSPPIVASPQFNVQYSGLDSVAAVAADDVWAVGSTSTASSNRVIVFNRALIVHWNGITWQTVPPPEVLPSPTSLSSSYLTSIAAAGGHVWAVGYVQDASNTSHGTPLILQWDGQQWSRATVPDLAMSARLYGVTALSSTDAWAVGARDDGHDLIFHWDGKVWSAINPPPVNGYFGLTKVSASGPHDIWMAGDADRLPFVLHWDGQTWTRTRTPGFGVGVFGRLRGRGQQTWTRTPGLEDYSESRLGYLNDIVAIHPDDVWLVGETNTNRMLLLHWNGHTWAALSDPLPSAQSSLLNAVTAVEGDLWIAGAATFANGNPHGESVALRYGPSPCVATSRIFPQTAQTVYEPFLSYWDDHGGLAQQGYPLTTPHTEQSATDNKVYQTQYFERAVFEQHPENAPPYDVLLSLLGVEAYSQRYGAAGAPGQHVNPDRARRFPETGHTVGGAFRSYWEAHGGLAQQGYPISEEFQERNALNGQTYTVQYFQRAVFEYHPENAGTPYVVLLSQLGRFAAQRRGLAAP